MSAAIIATAEDLRFAKLRRLYDAQKAAPQVAIFDGGQEKEELRLAKLENAVLHDILERQFRKVTAQRATIRRAYKLLRKQGFTLKSV